MPNAPIRLTLPYPPNNNHRLKLNKRRGRVYLSPEARDYPDVVKDHALVAGVREPFGSFVGVKVTLYRARKSGDADGPIKALFDALQGVAYRNDNQIVAYHVYRRDDPKNPRVEVEIYLALPCE